MVSLAINGNLGDRIGTSKNWIANKTRYIYTEDKKRLEFKGIITLYFKDEHIISQKFASRQHRSDIIAKWSMVYNLKGRQDIYYQIIHL